MPTSVALPAGTGGLRRDSLALCHQVMTLDRNKLTRLLGSLSDHVMRALEQGLRAALDLQGD